MSVYVALPNLQYERDKWELLDLTLKLNEVINKHLRSAYETLY